jgi:hypothetical protein
MRDEAYLAVSAITEFYIENLTAREYIINVAKAMYRIRR